MDLSLFQFDFDMTFAAFFMNADKTIYGRYGTRSEYDVTTKDISLSGFGKAMQAALDLHRDYPSNKSALLAKTGPTPQQRTPEDFPKLAGFKPDLDYQGNVLQSCMHCHQVLDAKRDWLRTKNKPVPDNVLFPFPLPDLLGMDLDPGEKARVRHVAPDSPAAKAGFQDGDDIEQLNGQPILSIADVQWVLHHAEDGARLKAAVRREGQSHTLAVSLPDRWRRQSNILWRATTWEMNRLVGGSLKWANLNESERKKLEIAPNSTAIRVDYVGWWKPYQAGKRAGFLKDDVMISFDGQRNLKTVNEFYAYAMNQTRKGQSVDVEILRNGKRMTLQLPMQ